MDKVMATTPAAVSCMHAAWHTHPGAGTSLTAAIHYTPAQTCTITARRTPTAGPAPLACQTPAP